MGCLVYNVLYRTAIQGYRVSSTLLKFYGEKKKSIKKSYSFPTMYVVITFSVLAELCQLSGYFSFPDHII